MISVLFLILGVYTPGLNEILDLYPLRGKDWGKVAAAGTELTLCVYVYCFFFFPLMAYI